MSAPLSDETENAPAAASATSKPEDPQPWMKESIEPTRNARPPAVDVESPSSAAKNEARLFYKSTAEEGLTRYVDAAAYSRFLDDTHVNARYLYYKKCWNDEWQGIFPEVELESGESRYTEREEKLLDQKNEFGKRLGELESWLSAQKELWLRKYATTTALYPRAAGIVSQGRLPEVQLTGDGGLGPAQLPEVTPLAEPTATEPLETPRPEVAPYAEAQPMGSESDSTDRPRSSDELSSIMPVQAGTTDDLAASKEAPGSIEEPRPTDKLALEVDSEKVRREIARKDLENEARIRWKQTTGIEAEIPFAWVYKSANVHFSDAYKWRRGKLPDASAVSKKLVLEFRKPHPPSDPRLTDNEACLADEPI